MYYFLTDCFLIVLENYRILENTMSYFFFKRRLKNKTVLFSSWICFIFRNFTQHKNLQTRNIFSLDKELIQMQIFFLITPLTLKIFQIFITQRGFGFRTVWTTFAFLVDFISNELFLLTLQRFSGSLSDSLKSIQRTIKI